MSTDRELYPVGEIRLHRHGALPSFTDAALANVDQITAWSWENLAPVNVHVWDRRLVDGNQAWWTEIQGSRAPRPDVPPAYSYRAFAKQREREIHVLLDETETADSLLWIVLHELTHIALNDARFLRYMFAHEDESAGRDGAFVPGRDDDAAHEALAEEQFCNRVASSFFLGNAPSFDRAWWRARVEAQMAVRLAA